MIANPFKTLSAILIQLPRASSLSEDDIIDFVQVRTGALRERLRSCSSQARPDPCIAISEDADLMMEGCVFGLHSEGLSS